MLLRKSPYSPRYSCALHLMVVTVGILGTVVRLVLSSNLFDGGKAAVFDIVFEDLLFFGPLALVSIISIIYLSTSKRVRSYYGALKYPGPPVLPTFDGVSTMGLEDKK